MSFVYVTEHGALIRLSGGKIIIEKAKKILAEIPKNTIEGMVILNGNTGKCSNNFTSNRRIFKYRCACYVDFGYAKILRSP